MKFNVSAQLEYEAQTEGVLILNVHALRTPRQTVFDEQFIVEPHIKPEELFAINGENRLIRLEVTQPGPIKISYTAIVDNNYFQKDYKNVNQPSMAHIDAQVLPYLYPSRYCQSDKLFRLANHLFGEIGNAYEQVIALTNWIHDNVEYQSGSTDTHTSAFDTVTEQTGVCRDFAHLGIALCRALTIPARYFTGYAYQLKPADFHACFEAYIGDEWVLFDATKLAPLNGMIKIATGRDAADTSTANIFGEINFISMQVSCIVAEGNFTPVYL
jgi:transglutaminase-like putative cysteine protease